MSFDVASTNCCVFLVQEAWCEVGDDWMVALHDKDRYRTASVGMGDGLSERLPFRQTQCDTGPCRLPFHLSKRLVELSQIDASEIGSHRDHHPPP